MMAFGVDLAESASKALADGFVHGLPHVVLVAIVAVSSYYQQKQIQGRNPNAEIPPQQKMLMRLMPAMFVVFAFVSPSAPGRVLRGVEPLPDRHAGLHHPDPLPRRGLARRPGPEGGPRGQEAQGATGGADDLLPRLGKKATGRRGHRGRRRRRPAKATTPADRPAPRAAATAPRRWRPTSRTTGTQNRSKKKKKRR